MYDITGYYSASTVAEAAALLKEHPQGRIICGGSDLLIKIREGKIAGCQLISIREIPQLHKIERKENGDIYIGAATAFSHVTNNEIIQKYIPVLGEAVDMVGGPQVRNIGTIGGNVCNGAVSADSAPTLFSLEAVLHLMGSEGQRIVPITEFYLGPGKVDLKPGEILTHIVIPAEKYQGYSGNYIKYSMRKAMDIATLSCSVVSKINTQGNYLEDVRITFGVAAPTPYRCRKTEEALRGKAISPELYSDLAMLIRDEINPRDSWRASRDFRLQIGGEIAVRALQAAIEGGAADE